MFERAEKAACFIKENCGEAKIGLILGSGLADVLNIENPRTVSYADIPNFPVSTTLSHKSEWVCGTVCGKKVYAMKGRFHYYEGYSGEDIALPLRVMKLLGVETVIITNASGGINKDYRSGDLMLIKDHINLSGINPLRGKNDERFGPRFPDMSDAYDSALRETAKQTAKELGIDLKEGVYIGFSGPSYETPAEIRMAAMLGADAVGMSTVGDVIAANHCGIKVIGISFIANSAAGISESPLEHSEITKAVNEGAEKFSELLTEIIRKI